ncbi:hypothetical protein [Pseudolactococcus insecticola]|uniref:DUF4160 domain-containing protein n=1 Tax=Pseudolactococcus insecticola TaxID=2709158 RepID=A0A6A0B5Z1_9LACT|nr:hypothetical protein [Lactococcus insecticola]GFH40849.1 hypothetical protein Hs20B_12470 [Lactococcus insecticola]
MPRYDFGIFGIEVRTNEHNHKGQKAHVHIYIGGIEQGSMFLDGTVKDGLNGISGKVKKIIARAIVIDQEKYQELWDVYQSSEY